MTPQPFTIVFRNDHDLVREATEGLLKSKFRQATVIPARDFNESIRRIGEVVQQNKPQNRPIVSLTDMKFPGEDGKTSPTAGLDLIRRIHRDYPEVLCIAHSFDGKSAVRDELMKMDVHFFEKSKPEVIVTAIRDAL